MRQCCQGWGGAMSNKIHMISLVFVTFSCKKASCHQCKREWTTLCNDLYHLIKLTVTVMSVQDVEEREHSLVVMTAQVRVCTKLPHPFCPRSFFLQIFDGPTVHYYPIGTFCGLGLPPPVRSSTSTVTLQFQSDSIEGGRGFLVEWTAVQDSGPPPTIPPGQTKQWRKQHNIWDTHMLLHTQKEK